MHRLLLSAFWASAIGCIGAVAFAAVASSPFGFVIAGMLACSAVLSVSAMCWDDLGGKTSLAGLLLGKKGYAEEDGPDVVIDVHSIKVAGVFLVASDLLAYLRGGTGTYREPGTGQRSQWPDQAELFLAWKATKRAAAEAAHELNDWEAAHEPVHLLCATARRTVLTDGHNRRLTLPELSPVGTGRTAHPGRR